MTDTAFRNAVIEVVKGISKKGFKTYGQVAAEAKRPGAAREVASIIKKNKHHFKACHKLANDGKSWVCTNQRDYVPCHRVVSANPKKRDVGYLGRTDAASIAFKTMLRDKEL